MTAPSLPLIAISVLHWNTGTATLRCLQALQVLRYPNFRIVLIDNASTDHSLAQIRIQHPQLTVISNASNVGFAEGHRRGLQQAVEWNADALWLINSDTEVEANALDVLVTAWQNHGEAIYSAAPLSRHDGNEVRLNFPAKYLDVAARPSAFHRDAVIVFDALWQRRTPLRVGAVAGSCMLLPLSLVQRHGWIGSAWFLYCEEIDYCYRLGEQQVAIFLVPQAQVWHRGGGSHRDQIGVADCVAYYRARNEIALALLHAGRLTGWLTALKKVLRSAQVMTWRPRRGALILLGVRDALIGRMGKTLAPENFVAGPG